MSEKNDRGVEPPVELAHFPPPGSWSRGQEQERLAGPWGGRAELGSGSHREPLVSGVRLFKRGPQASLVQWMLWEGGPGALVLEKSNPETEGQGGVVALKSWQCLEES